MKMKMKNFNLIRVYVFFSLSLATIKLEKRNYLLMNILNFFWTMFLFSFYFSWKKWKKNWV